MKRLNMLLTIITIIIKHIYVPSSVLVINNSMKQYHLTFYVKASTLIILTSIILDQHYEIIVTNNG